MAAAHHDGPALLQLRCAALAPYGGTEGIVSDQGAGFQAQDDVAVLQAVEIEPRSLALRTPWQNLLEAQLQVPCRLADFQCAQAGPVDEMQRFHAAFIETLHPTRHWAHQERAESRGTPVDVGGWVRGRAVDPERLRRLCGRVQFLRTRKKRFRATGTRPR